jgi:hypothetical protein
MRRILLLPAFGLVLGVWSGLGAAAPPELPTFTGEPSGNAGTAPAGPVSGDAPAALAQAPAAPAEPIYPVTPAAGPWMICAASYMGPDAPELARQLVLEIRSRHNLPAYIFNHGDEERRKQREEHERLRQLYPGVPIRRRIVRVPEQCAVLVGGYPDMESASQALPAIKKLPLPELKLEAGKLAYDTMSVYSPNHEHKATDVKRVPINPFTNAFVTRNPTVPAEPKQVPKFDPFWKELNADEEYSLLSCPRPWTLVVKEYQGSAIVQPQSGSSNFLKMLGLGGNKPGEGLSAAAKQAHELAKVLRDKRLGFTAYVLHTRTKSIVTVGAFNSPDDPELMRTQRQLASLKFSGPNQKDPIGLFASPMLMEVPHP